MTHHDYILWVMSIITIIYHTRTIVIGSHILFFWRRVDTKREIRETALMMVISTMVVLQCIHFIYVATTINTDWRDILITTPDLLVGHLFFNILNRRHFIYNILTRAGRLANRAGVVCE